MRKISLLSICILAAATSCHTKVKNDSSQASDSPQYMTKAVVEPIQDAKTTANGHLWILTIDGHILYTESNGSRWQEIPTNDVGKAIKMDFLDSNHGWLVNDSNEVWRTFDGGNNWSKLAKLHSVQKVMAIEFIDASYGWAYGPLLVWHTNDGGASWVKSAPNRHVPITDERLISNAHFVNLDSCVLGGQGGKVFVTHTGGEMWKVQQVGSKQAAMESVFFIDEHTGWVAGFPSGVYWSGDGGNTWTHQTVDKIMSVYSIHFINRNEGWILGLLYDGNIEENRGGALFHTTDGGETWSILTDRLPEMMNQKVYFTDNANGYLISLSKVYKSSDGGKTWQQVLDVLHR